MAFLDIMPITAGHVLVIPRNHRVKLGDLQGSEGAALGQWLPAVSRAVMRALGKGDGDWNVVQNNGKASCKPSRAAASSDMLPPFQVPRPRRWFLMFTITSYPERLKCRRFVREVGPCLAEASAKTWTMTRPRCSPPRFGKSWSTI